MIHTRSLSNPRSSNAHPRSRDHGAHSHRPAKRNRRGRQGPALGSRGGGLGEGIGEPLPRRRCARRPGARRLPRSRRHSLELGRQAHPSEGGHAGLVHGVRGRLGAGRGHRRLEASLGGVHGNGSRPEAASSWNSHGGSRRHRDQLRRGVDCTIGLGTVVRRGHRGRCDYVAFRAAARIRRGTYFSADRPGGEGAGHRVRTWSRYVTPRSVRPQPRHRARAHPKSRFCRAPIPPIAWLSSSANAD